MLEIGVNNAIDYLRGRGLTATQAAELADGVSNAVLCIETPDRKLVLKQSRPQLRTQQAWFSDIDRIWRERDAMVLLGKLLPSGVVPRVLFSDPANYLFAMSHAPEPFRNWRSVLLAGEVEPSLGESAGRLLGMIHAATANHASLLEPFVDRKVFEQLRVEPFYVRVQDRCPDLAADIQSLIDRCRSLRLGMCHGDFSPKNLLLHADGFTLVDYETCHWGDVTFDLGFFLSHLMLKWVHLPRCREAIAELTGQFWCGYRMANSHGSGADRLFFAIAHLAGCLLARVDGTSPAPYLTGEMEIQTVRRLARRLLAERPNDWDAVLAFARQIA